MRHIASLFAMSLFAASSAYAIPHISTAALNSGPDCNLLQKVDFVPAQEGFQTLSVPLSMSAAAVKIQYQRNGYLSTCSGAFISDEGHVLTAAHCLEDCGRLTDSTTGKPICFLTVNGREQAAEIVVNTTCDITALTNARAATAQGQTTNSKCASQGDLAVLKLKDVPEGFACLPIAKQDPQVGDSVFAFGTPQKTDRKKADRPNAQDSDGGFSVSTGEIIRSNTCEGTKWTGNFLKGNKIETVDQQLVDDPKLLQKLQDSGRLQTTVDSNSGFSGAPMVSEKSLEIVGVDSIRLSNRNNADHECKGAIFYESARFLQGTAEAWNQGFDVKSLKCQSHRVGGAPTAL